MLILAPALLWGCKDRQGRSTIAGAGGYATQISEATSYATPQADSVLHHRVWVAAQALAANSAGTPVATLSTPAVQTPADGALVLVQVLLQNTRTLAALNDNKGNLYRPLDRMHTYAGVDAGSALFVCPQARGGEGHVWGLRKAPGHEADEATIYVVALHGPAQIGAWSFSNTAPYSSARPITTTADHSIVVSFWGPADYSGSAQNPDNVYTPPAGWAMGGQNPNGFNQNSGAFAWMPVPRAGTVVDPQWRSRKSVKGNGSMWLVEVRR